MENKNIVTRSYTIVFRVEREDFCVLFFFFFWQCVIIFRNVLIRATGRILRGPPLAPITFFFFYVFIIFKTQRERYWEYFIETIFYFRIFWKNRKKRNYYSVNVSPIACKHVDKISRWISPVLIPKMCTGTTIYTSVCRKQFCFRRPGTFDGWRWYEWSKEKENRQTPTARRCVKVCI